MRTERIERLTTHEADEITEMLKNMFAPGIADFLIYKDKNYPAYLKKLIHNSKNDYLFVVRKESQIAGFAHFKTHENDLFLNNIGFLLDTRNLGFGKKLLGFALKEIAKEKNHQYFRLDVFQENTRALNWYKKLGMEKESKKYWYDVSVEIPITAKSQFSNTIKLDKNGFNGIYYSGEKIATLINESMVFTNLHAIKSFSKHNNFYFSKACLITEQSFHYPLLAKSLRLFAEMEKINL